MSATLKLSCKCGAKMSVAAKESGKRARCVGCGNAFRVPEIQTANPRRGPKTGGNDKKFDPTQSAAAAVAANALGGSGTSLKRSPPKTSTTTKAKRSPCQSCKKPIDDTAVVCLYCGYHKKLGRRLKQAEDDTPDVGAPLLIHLASVLAAIVIAAVIFFVCRGIEGPLFLQVYFAMFVVTAAAVVVVRKLSFDGDYANHAAMIIVGGAGGARLFDALAAGRFRVTFLIVGLLISTWVFFATKTESPDEGTTFRNDHGGMGSVAATILFGLAAAMMGAVFFVPIVGEIVVQLAGLILMAFIVFGKYVYSKITGTEFEWGGSGDCSSSGCSSCSSCGGGCGGGGCGGCGG